MSKKTRPESELYPKHHKAWDLEPYYSRHIGGMTEFQLHDKSDIAEQLAWRDQRIAVLESQLQEAEMCCGHGTASRGADAAAIRCTACGAPERHANRVECREYWAIHGRAGATEVKSAEAEVNWDRGKL